MLSIALANPSQDFTRCSSVTGCVIRRCIGQRWFVISILIKYWFVQWFHNALIIHAPFVEIKLVSVSSTTNPNVHDTPPALRITITIDKPPKPKQLEARKQISPQVATIYANVDCMLGCRYFVLGWDCFRFARIEKGNTIGHGRTQ